MSNVQHENESAIPASPSLERTVVLIGLMGAGKTTVGRRLAKRLDVPFVDADAEVERAAGCSVNDIFECYGEAAFRDGERRVIARLLEKEPHILASGGGAFMNADTRESIREHAVSVWLYADIATLVGRVKKKDSRPLLRGKAPEKVLGDLAKQRYPVYALADIRVESSGGPHEDVVEAVIDALAERSIARRP